MDPYFVVALLMQWLALWLFLYMLLRRPRSRASLLTGIAFLCLWAYLLTYALWLAHVSTTVAVIALQWIGNWSVFAPALLFHAVLTLPGVHMRHQRLVVGAAYAAAAAAFALGLSDTLVYDVTAVPPAGADAYFPVGPLYWTSALQTAGTLGLVLVALVRSRSTMGGGGSETRTRGVRDPLVVGTTTMFVAAVILFGNALAGFPFQDSIL